MTLKVQILRKPSEAKETLGSLAVIRNGKVTFKCVTLELPWLKNAKQISCIPPGIYKVVRRNTPKRGDHFHVTNVPGRSYILFHPGAYYTHTLGCILPGRSYADLNKDGVLDLVHSGDTFKELLKAIPETEFELEIK